MMEEGIEAYKIVSTVDRRGSNAILLYDSIYKDVAHLTEDIQEPCFLEYRQIIKTLQRYFPVYEKGSIVYAAENSPGICCFNTKDDAEVFKQWEFLHYLRSADVIRRRRLIQIIKVKGFNLITNDMKSAAPLWSAWGDFISVGQRSYRRPLPPGFLGFEYIEVME